jgi:transcriptional regulator of acetoin/glycerol metabolism
MIYDAVSQHNSGVLALRRFDKAIGGQFPPCAATPHAVIPAYELLSFPARLPTLKQAGDLLVKEAMRRANGNQTQAARLLGISRPALIKRLQK